MSAFWHLHVPWKALEDALDLVTCQSAPESPTGLLFSAGHECGAETLIQASTLLDLGTLQVRDAVHSGPIDAWTRMIIQHHTMNPSSELVPFARDRSDASPISDEPEIQIGDERLYGLPLAVARPDLLDDRVKSLLYLRVNPAPLAVSHRREPRIGSRAAWCLESS
jgi:hypothetical protein